MKYNIIINLQLKLQTLKFNFKITNYKLQFILQLIMYTNNFIFLFDR